MKDDKLSEPAGSSRTDKPRASLRLVFGCGYLGSRVAKLWRESGDKIYVVTRSQQRADELAAQGLQPVVADVCEPKSLGGLPAVDTVLFSVGHDRRLNQTINDVYVGGLSNLLAALPAETGRAIYISTTGVYGPAEGNWVDEQTPPAPDREGGKASLAAEQVLANHPLGKRSVILRLAGLYGPGRIPYIDKLRAGEPLAVPSQGWLNLIHVDDAAAIVVAVSKWAAENLFDDGCEIFNVSDGHPVIRGDYYSEVARLVGAVPPSFVEADENLPATQRARGDKRIDNRKLMETLAIPSLEFPNYLAGLASILDEKDLQK